MESPERVVTIDALTNLDPGQDIIVETMTVWPILPT
jgi:hypothetical protein